MILLMRGTRIVQFLAAWGKRVVSRAWGTGGPGVSCLVGADFQFLQDEKSFGDGLHNKVNVLVSLEPDSNCILKSD